MNLSRRQFLVGSTALALTIPFAHIRAADTIRLVAKPADMQLLPEKYSKTKIWGYDGLAPGPAIRLRQGESVKREFVNQLPQPSTIHWHGIRIENKMDGVPDLTQDKVPSGKSFLYDFVVPDAGTYWYHPHNKTWEQMARGLYGALIVDERNPPEVDTDEVLLIDDWRLNRSGQIDESFGAMMDWSHGGRFGNWITVNGKAPFEKSVKRNERIRLRLINTANARIFNLRLTGMQAWAVAYDGQPLTAPIATEQMFLAPAQRIDLIVDIIAEEGEEAGIYSVEREGHRRITSLKVNGVRRSTPMVSPHPLPANPVPQIDPMATPRKFTLRMEGGAMGRMRGAMMGGRMMGMRQLVNSGKVWAMNGQVDMLDEPLLDAKRDEVVHIEIINDTGWPHGMHLHGFHFRQVMRDGKMGPLRDTLLMDAEETATIAFVADNPGKWLLHCHMLEHAASGMTTWINVS